MPERDPLTVLLIDDHPLMRRGLSQLISLDDNVAVVGEASNGHEGLAMAKKLSPDLVVLDLNMPGRDGLSTLRAIREEELECRVIIYTVSNNEDDVVAALRAGADGYLLKNMPPMEMLASLKSSAEGRVVLSDRLTDLLAQALRHEGRSRKPDNAELTERELDILKGLAAGRSNKLIARQFDIAEGTVKVHVKRILKKLNLNSRVEAAVWAIKNGIGS